MEEIEVKFLDVDVSTLEEKLKSLGAQSLGKFHYRQSVFDYPDLRLAKDLSWIRLRDEVDRVTLTFKKRMNVGDNPLLDGGMHEIEVVVDDFKKTEELMHATGFKEKFYEEKYRTRYKFGNVECDIDEWPLIPPYLELEGPSYEEIKKVATALGFPWNVHCKCSAMQVFEKYGIDENSFSVLTFERQVKK